LAICGSTPPIQLNLLPIAAVLRHQAFRGLILHIDLLNYVVMMALLPVLLLENIKKYKSKQL